MGKITDILKKIVKMGSKELLDRYKHIVRAQAVREYLDLKEDKLLTTEVRLIGEEIVNRMSNNKPHFSVSVVKEDRKKDELFMDLLKDDSE